MSYCKSQAIFNIALLVLILVLTGCANGAAGAPLPSTLPPALPVASPTAAVADLPPAIATLSSPKPSPTLAAVTPEPTATATSSPTLTPVPAPATAGCSCPISHVVIISIDGLRPDALEEADTPTLDALRAQGAYQPAAQTVLPSVTLVSHASMVSGMSPEKHGIFWNSNDPELGKVQGPTLFSVAHEAGLSTAMVVGKPKLEHLVLPGSVDNYIYAGFTDRQVVNETVAVIQSDMPALLFIHLPDVDSAGHALGWMSLGQLLAVSLTDRLIGEVVSALETEGYLEQTLLIITADHGGSGIKHGSDSPEDMTIPWLAVGPGAPAGKVLQSEIVTYDTAATVLAAFGLPIPTNWDGRPVLEIFEQEPQ